MNSTVLTQENADEVEEVTTEETDQEENTEDAE